MLLSLLGGLGWLLFLRPSTAQQSEAPATEYFQDVSAVPEGRFTYTGVKGGSWDYVLNQQNVLSRGQTLAGALAIAQPDLRLTFDPVNLVPQEAVDSNAVETSFIGDAPGESSSVQTTLDGVQEAIARVQYGDSDFALLPLWPEVYTLPPELDAQVVAYDGLAFFVAFSYSQRNEGLPTALREKSRWRTCAKSTPIMWNGVISAAPISPPSAMLPPIQRPRLC
ncbi:MAG: hypothetical protein F6K65_43870 [Moorea sp. SIO3C2]|nr:hypothetical protein [Moorena sp. SIO3C2]